MQRNRENFFIPFLYYYRFDSFIFIRRITFYFSHLISHTRYGIMDAILYTETGDGSNKACHYQPLIQIRLNDELFFLNQ